MSRRDFETFFLGVAIFLYSKINVIYLIQATLLTHLVFKIN